MVVVPIIITSVLSDGIVPPFLREVQVQILICRCQFHGFQFPWYFTHLLNSYLWKIESWALWIIDLNQFSISEILSGGVFSLMKRKNVRKDMQFCPFQSSRVSSISSLLQEDSQGDLPLITYKPLKQWGTRGSHVSVLFLSFDCELPVEGIEF